MPQKGLASPVCWCVGRLPLPQKTRAEMRAIGATVLSARAAKNVSHLPGPRVGGRVPGVPTRVSETLCPITHGGPFPWLALEVGRPASDDRLGVESTYVAVARLPVGDLSEYSSRTDHVPSRWGTSGMSGEAGIPGGDHRNVSFRITSPAAGVVKTRLALLSMMTWPLSSRLTYLYWKVVDAGSGTSGAWAIGRSCPATSRCRAPDEPPAIAAQRSRFRLGPARAFKG